MRVSACHFQQELMKTGPGPRLRSHTKVWKGGLPGLMTITAGMKDWWTGDEERPSPVTNPSTSSLRNLICLPTTWLQSFGCWVNWGTDTHRWNEYPQRIGETAHAGPPSELQSQLGICSKLAVGVMGPLQDKGDRRWCWLKDSLRLRGCHACLLQVLPCRKHYLGDHSSLGFRSNRGDSCPPGRNNMDLPWHDLVTLHTPPNSFLQDGLKEKRLGHSQRLLCSLGPCPTAKQSPTGYWRSPIYQPLSPFLPSIAPRGLLRTSLTTLPSPPSAR